MNLSQAVKDGSPFKLRTVPIVTVSGAHSGVGKTSVIEAFLRILKGWSALKVTLTHRKGECPVHKGCHTCDELDSGFSIVRDKKIIQTKGKDTARFKQAGAKRVLWLRSSPEALEQGIKQALSLFNPSAEISGFKTSDECSAASGGNPDFSQGGSTRAKGLIIETNSALRYLKPDLAILVKRKDSILKPSAREILERIDLTVEL